MDEAVTTREGALIGAGLVLAAGAEERQDLEASYTGFYDICHTVYKSTCWYCQ